MTGSDQMGDRLAEIQARLRRREVGDDDVPWLVAALVAERAQVTALAHDRLVEDLRWSADLAAERAENERLQRIFNHLTRYATFWSTLRSAADHAKTLDENRLSEADLAYLEGLPS